MEDAYEIEKLNNDEKRNEDSIEESENTNENVKRNNIWIIVSIVSLMFIFVSSFVYKKYISNKK